MTLEFTKFVLYFIKTRASILQIISKIFCNASENSSTAFKFVSRSYIWEILHFTIDKMDKHVIKLNEELTEARDKLKKVVIKDEPDFAFSLEDENTNKENIDNNKKK